MPPKCEHGVSRHDGRFTGMWYAPFDECQCCGASYPYIDMASGPPWKTRSWTKGKCKECGGHYIELPGAAMSTPTIPEAP